jgi:hypothetical protein
MSLTVIERRRRVATLVFRPVDGLSATLGRPPFERGPVRPVRFGIAGRWAGGVVQPIAGGSPKPVFNLSGDTVYRDFALPAATYRIDIVRDPARAEDAVYEDLDPAQRDLVWDPAAPGSGLPGYPNHPSRFVPVRLFPSDSYPFPTGSTLVRGSLLWYDGTALAGAVVRDPTALLPRSYAGPRGNFVLTYRATAANGPANLELDSTDVVASSRPDGAAYLASLPAVWPTQWERGTTRSVRLGRLDGIVRRSDGRPLKDATLRLAGRPGFVRTNNLGRWMYYFPPLTAAGIVDITVQHPDFANMVLANVAFPADASATAPTAIMS